MNDLCDPEISMKDRQRKNEKDSKKERKSNGKVRDRKRPQDYI